MSAFHELAVFVEEISKRYFEDLPAVEPVLEDTFYLFGLPATTGATEAARALRYLFVQNQIFGVLHHRVFEPFIFTSTYDDHEAFALESFLAAVSKTISAKSVRREALWRAVTARAIYATEYGRKAASAVATRVSQEIMDKVRPLASAETVSALFQAVCTVSKTAVELWRQVRVELQVVHSSMPSTPKTGGSYGAVEDMLWIRPHVVREGFGVLAADMEHSDAIRVYLQGTMLHQHSPIVLARQEELRREGEAGWLNQEVGY
jgi:hypothetical protein